MENLACLFEFSVKSRYEIERPIASIDLTSITFGLRHVIFCTQIIIEFWIDYSNFFSRLKITFIQAKNVSVWEWKRRKNFKEKVTSIKSMLLETIKSDLPSERQDLSRSNIIINIQSRFEPFYVYLIIRNKIDFHICLFLLICMDISEKCSPEHISSKMPGYSWQSLSWFWGFCEWTRNIAGSRS